MPHLFLTGATGLLGSYVLRDLLLRGVRLAVLVRSTKRLTAQERIEDLLYGWEKRLGHSLPRPIVLEGDLSRPDLGLDNQSTEWVSRHCDRLLHNAASLSFYGTDKSDEPWRSNLGGTEHVLALCRHTGIRQFHHVSTAYVAGQRTGLCLETELDVGQEPGNDYEASKCQSEELVRSAEWIDESTVYRPGIIIGDSKNGYTTTFHGFYVPLKVNSILMGHPENFGMRNNAENSQAVGDKLVSVLGMDGTEAKHLVPVDWVSTAMCEILSDPQLHGKTYHLTPHRPVAVSLMQQVIQDVMLRNTSTKNPRPLFASQQQWPKFVESFVEQVSVYRAYWRDDPEFDQTNISQALPDLPCPEVDREMLDRTCQYAIDANFGWPHPPVESPPLDVGARLNRWLTSVETEGETYLGLQVNGRGGGEWELTASDGHLVHAVPGISSRCQTTLYLNSTTFGQLSAQELSVGQGIDSGRIVIQGNTVSHPYLTQFLQPLIDAEHESTAAASPG